MLIDIHMLKSFPPTNLNRDETGTPKSCFFGGSQRGRISSQCLKHAWRSSAALKALNLGLRTRYLPELVAQELRRQNVQENFIAECAAKLTKMGSKDKKSTTESVPADNNGEEREEDTVSGNVTPQIIFYAPEDIAAVAVLVKAQIDLLIAKSTDAASALKQFKEIKIKAWQDELKIQAAIRPITLDMALFGRMVTDPSFRNVEASLQAAHAISTHPVVMESDFYTAVDDLAKDYGNHEGSAMMGDIDYNACCYYFYASLDTDQLGENVKGSPEAAAALDRIVPALLETMAFVNPSGKQNTFAGHVLPALICVECKERKIPVSYANAFEKPVRSSNGYTVPSVESLAKLIDRYDERFGMPIRERLWFSPEGGSKPQKATEIMTLPSLCEAAGGWLREV